MPDGVILPNGKILIVNGGRTGTAGRCSLFHVCVFWFVNLLIDTGYGNLKYRIGESNADNPTFTPLLYDPSAPLGPRFSREDMPTSPIGRLYHSIA
jgi:hypothetical protein